MEAGPRPTSPPGPLSHLPPLPRERGRLARNLSFGSLTSFMSFVLSRLARDGPAAIRCAASGGIMRKISILGLFALLVLAAALAPAGAAEPRSLRFEKTVSYKTGKLIDLGATVGPVRIAQVEISQPSGS